MKDSVKLLILFVLGGLAQDILTINDNQAVWKQSQRLNILRRLGARSAIANESEPLGARPGAS